MKKTLINWLNLGACGEYTVFELYEMYTGVNYEEFKKIVHSWAKKKRRID